MTRRSEPRRAGERAERRLAEVIEGVGALVAVLRAEPIPLSPAPAPEPEAT